MMINRTIKVFAGAFFVAAVLTAVVIMAVGCSGRKSETLKYGNVTMGDIKIVVSTTGTIEAQKTVEVSTQVSGTVMKVYADNNSIVKKGQILAVLDTKLLEISVKSAEADLLKAKSEYELALQEYNTNISLNKDKLVSDLELDKLRVTKDGAYATKLSAESKLMTARTNLDYAVIKSPINGIVLEKGVEEGQTVAASLSAPTLFTIAEDLGNIRIEALVAEADIGSIKKGQKATFTVDAYPDETFSGLVNDVLMTATVESNVVNYTVIINAKNKRNILLPGMTATVDFIVSEKTGVLSVPNSALSYNPSPDTLKKLGVKMPEPPKFKAKNAGFENGDMPPPGMNGTDKSAMPLSNGNGKQDKTMGHLWIVDESGKVKFVPVKKGISDGQITEIISSDINEGDKIVYGGSSGSATSTQKTSSGNNNRGGMGGPPPMMF